MTKSGTLLFGLSLLLAALGVVASHAQQGGRAAAEPPCSGLFCPEPAAAPAKASKKKTARQQKAAKPGRTAKSATKPQDDKKASAVERTPFTEEERYSAIVPGLPGIRFWADSLGAWMLGALPEDEEEGFRAHLESCADCRAEAESLRVAVDALPAAAPPMLPPPALKGRVMAIVEREA